MTRKKNPEAAARTAEIRRMVAEGYLQIVIAETLGVSPGYVSQIIALHGIGRTEKRTDRKCLACRGTFGSTGLGNRICPICKSSDEWCGAAVVHGVAL